MKRLPLLLFLATALDTSLAHAQTVLDATVFIDTIAHRNESNFSIDKDGQSLIVRYAKYGAPFTSTYKTSDTCKVLRTTTFQRDFCLQLKLYIEREFSDGRTKFTGLNSQEMARVSYELFADNSLPQCKLDNVFLDESSSAEIYLSNLDYRSARPEYVSLGNSFLTGWTFGVNARPGKSAICTTTYWDTDRTSPAALREFHELLRAQQDKVAAGYQSSFLADKRSNAKFPEFARFAKSDVFHQLVDDFARRRQVDSQCTTRLGYDLPNESFIPRVRAAVSFLEGSECNRNPDPF